MKHLFQFHDKKSPTGSHRNKIRLRRFCSFTANSFVKNHLTTKVFLSLPIPVNVNDFHCLGKVVFN
jgi:hypothetical protein